MRLHAGTIIGLLLTVTLVTPFAAHADDEEKPLEARCYDVAARGELAVLGRTGGIVTIDISDPARPREIGRMGLNATIRVVALDGDRAWLAGGAYGVALVDISDPIAPQFLQRIDVSGKVRDVIPLNADRLLLAESRHGLSVMDVSDLQRARSVASISTRDEVRGLALNGDLLATAEEHGGVRLFDMSRPDNPDELAEIDVAGALDVAFVDSLLLVAAGKQGTLLFDVSEPHAPRQVGEIPADRSALTIIPHGRLALVGCGSAGVQVLDPFPPDGPRAIKRVRLSARFPAGRLAVSGQTVLVATDLSGFAVIDLEDVDDPRVLHPRSRRMRVREDPED